MQKGNHTKVFTENSEREHSKTPTISNRECQTSLENEHLK